MATKYFKATPSGSDSAKYYSTVLGNASDIQEVDPATALKGYDLSSVPTGIGNAVESSSLTKGGPDTKSPRYDLNPEDPYKNYVDKYFGDLNRTNLTPEDEQKIRDDTSARMQAQIDAINNIYAGLVAKENRAGEGRLGQTRALAARSGTLGSDFGDASLAKTDQYNADAIKALEDEKQLKLSAIFGKINEDAQKAIDAKKLEVKGNQEAYINYLKDNRDNAKQQVKDLAAGGLVSLDKLSEDQYKHLLDVTGYDPLTLESVFNANKSKADKIDYKTEKLDNGSVLLYGVDPKTNQLITKTYTADLGAGETLKIIDDKPYAVSTGADGKVTLRPVQGFVPNPKNVPEGDKVSAALKPVSSAINQLRGSDGYVDPQAYKDLYATFIQQNPGKGDSFLKEFPYSIYINPDDRSLFDK